MAESYDQAGNLQFLCLPEELPVNFSSRTVLHGVGERGRVD